MAVVGTFSGRRRDLLQMLKETAADVGGTFSGLNITCVDVYITILDVVYPIVLKESRTNICWYYLIV